MGSEPLSKAEIAEERRQNLPLPEDPPTASDWNSADARNVNVGSGAVESDISYGKGSEAGLREPASGGTSGGIDSGVGRQGVEGTEGHPPGVTKKGTTDAPVG